MYSRFVFGNFSDHNLNKRQRHPYGAFLDVFDGTGDQNLFWHCKKRMFQHKIRATSENAATDMVALQGFDPWTFGFPVMFKNGISGGSSNESTVAWMLG